MKTKLFFILLLNFLALSFTSLAWSGYDYGATTYETADDSLVVNSLGDQTTVSTYGTLGTNDWIPENSVKNYLKLEGYTVAYDYNPTAAHSWGVYDAALPTADLTELKFAGLLGDPRKEQNVYVLTEEYNRLNANAQADAIENIQNVNTVQNTNITNVQNTVNTHTSEINSLQTTTNNHTTQIDNINNVNIRQDADIAGLNRSVSELNESVNDINHRVDDLEKTQTIISGEVRLYDGRKFSVSTFVDYTTTRQTVDRAGVKVVYKFGESYEERLIRQLEAKLAKTNAVQTKNDFEIYTTKGGFGIRSKF